MARKRNPTSQPPLIQPAASSKSNDSEDKGVSTSFPEYAQFRELASEFARLTADIRTALRQEPKARDGWDKIGLIAKFLAPLLIPAIVAVVVAIAGHYITLIVQERDQRAQVAAQKLEQDSQRSIQERQIQAKLVELAIDVLKSDPTEKNMPIRTWAREVVDQWSGMKLPEAIQNQSIPTAARGIESSKIDVPDYFADIILQAYQGKLGSGINGMPLDQIIITMFEKDFIESGLINLTPEELSALKAGMVSADLKTKIIQAGRLKLSLLKVNETGILGEKTLRLLKNEL